MTTPSQHANERREKGKVQTISSINHNKEGSYAQLHIYLCCLDIELLASHDSHKTFIQ